MQGACRELPIAAGRAAAALASELRASARPVDCSGPEFQPPAVQLIAALHWAIGGVRETRCSGRGLRPLSSGLGALLLRLHLASAPLNARRLVAPAALQGGLQPAALSAAPPPQLPPAMTALHPWTLASQLLQLSFIIRPLHGRPPTCHTPRIQQ